MDSRQALFDTAQAVFEQAAFAVFDSPEETDGNPPAEEPSHFTLVKFEGPFFGCVVLAAGCRLAMMIAANMLGVEEDDPDAAEKTRDALGEISNMICGNLLPALAGAKPEFRIEAPEHISEEEYRRMRAAATPDSGAAISFSIENCAAELSLFLSGSPSGEN